MHFYDEAHITVRAGNGGDGMVAWHREKYVPRGGPSGGDGGDGGHVILRANQQLSTLHTFIAQKHFAAENGVKGGTQKMAGAGGSSLVLDVPVGTLVFREDTRELIADLAEHGSTLQVARGGRGGYGNARFATAQRQAPAFAELGEPGQTAELYLELKLVADVGIIGVPSAGKSTLIAAISNARPKIADYPFTTLVPNLGVVVHHGESFVASDVPGLIEGAHAGKGLGHAFLKHVERTAILVHLLDITRTDPAADYRMINEELARYSPVLAAKPQLVVASKVDVLDDATRKEMLADLAGQLGDVGRSIVGISAAAHIGLEALLDRILWVVQEARAARNAEEAARAAAPKVYTPAARVDRRIASIEEEGDGYRVSSPRLEQLAVMTDGRSDEALARLYDVLRKRGIIARLEKRGIVDGTPIFVGAHQLEYYRDTL